MNTNSLINYWSAFYTLYNSSIVNLSAKWNNQEAIYGNSCIEYNVNQYYLAFYLGVMIRTELDKGYTSSYSYYAKKYELEEKKKLLACNNIKLQDILDIFNISFVFSGGIGDMGIEENFEIEPTVITNLNSSSTIDIKFLLNNTSYCSSIFRDCLSPIVIPSVVSSMVNAISTFTTLPIEECIITGNQCSSIDLTTLVNYIQSLVPTGVNSKIININIASTGTTFTFPIPFSDANWIFAGELVCIETSTGNQVGYIITNQTASGFTINLVTGTDGTAQGLAVHA